MDTIDNILALADRYRDLKVGQGTAHAREALRTALTEALAAQQAEQGWVLVPVEPTQEMIEAYLQVAGKFQSAKSDWAAFLAAAPKGAQQADCTTTGVCVQSGLYCHSKQAEQVPHRQAFETWAVKILGDNPTWRESCDCELAWQAWMAAAPKGAQQAEQVPDAYQFRMRADWVPNWGEWGACNKERHDMYLRFPKMHSWNYETRELYAAHKVAQQASCEWKKDPDNEMGDTYHSNCGESWSFVDGGPKENRVSYCHHCGKPVKLAAPKGVV